MNETEKELASLLKKYDADFCYRKNPFTWCLIGHDSNGNIWETDDYEAKNIEQATKDAIDYLVAYNE
jgi:hypothetical protein